MADWFFDGVFMLVFDPFVLLFWIFISSFLPGALLSVSLLKKSEMKLIEKILVGFGLGFILPQLLPILLLIVGINYSFLVALASIVVFYAIAIYFYIREKPFELAIPQMPKISYEPVELLKNYGVQFFLVLIMLAAFWIRLQSYSPVFQELDPYYYTYSTQQIITQGQNPLDDKTSWYPELKVDHRYAPVLSYMEAMWYSLYTGGAGSYDNLLLASIASIYPPIAAALAVFFVYLLFASQYKREHAIIGAAMASFIPIFILKTLGGEMEVQPYAFFALSFFFAMYAWTVREKTMDKMMLFIAISIISFIGLLMGSSSAPVAYATLIIFIPLYAIMLFLKGEEEHVKTFAIMNAAIVLFGLYLPNIILSLFRFGDFAVSNFLPNSTSIVLFAITAFVYALYQVKKSVKDSEMRLYALFGILLVGTLLLAFTPLKDYVTGFVLRTIGFGEFNAPLQRTIAEQGTTGGMFQGMLGFMASSPEEVASAFSFGIEPLKAMFAAVISILFLPFTFFANMFFTVFSAILNAEVTFNAGIEYSTKENSLLMVTIALSIIAIITSFVRTLRMKTTTMFLLFAAIIFPPAIVGIMKAKYTIYLGYFFAAALAMVFGELEIGFLWLAKKTFNGENLKKAAAIITSGIILTGVVLVYLQFVHDGIGPMALISSLKTRFQDNPIAQKANFELLCNKIKSSGDYDAEICEAAADPVGYASKGTNYQFNSKLCSASLMENPFSPSELDKLSVNFRCQKITDYWIESMEWIRYNTESNSRTTSWWDYGHWINYFGQKNTVLRNEHLSLEMIGDVAHAYIDGSTQDLIDYMKSHDSKYALFDGELIIGGSVLGGKYGALNYLSCARDNDTTVNDSPGSSLCEIEHLWEMIYVPTEGDAKQCTISQSTGKTGMVAYAPNLEKDALGNLQNKFEPRYCIGEVTLASGQKADGTYYLDKKYENGDLKLNKAVMKYDYTTQEKVAVYTMFYTKEKIWLENGQIKDGYEDRKGKFYDSNLYKGYFLEDLPGFQLVFKSKGGEVKIYKLVE